MIRLNERRSKIIELKTIRKLRTKNRSLLVENIHSQTKQYLQPNTPHENSSSIWMNGWRQKKHTKYLPNTSSYFNKTKARVKERKYWQNVFTCVNSFEGRTEGRKKSVPQDSIKNMMSSWQKNTKRITEPHWNLSKKNNWQKIDYTNRKRYKVLKGFPCCFLFPGMIPSIPLQIKWKEQMSVSQSLSA